MAIPKTGSISVTQVRQDCGLAAAGSMILDRAVQNRIGQSSGGYSLSAHRGLVTRPQLSIVGNWNDTMTRKDVGYKGYSPEWSDSSVSISGMNVICGVRQTGYGGGDAGAEYRVNNTIGQDGLYRITGSVSCTYDSSYRGTLQYQIAVVSGTHGYLQGITRIEHIDNNDPTGIYGSSKTFNATMQLSTSRPYISMIMYYIAKDGGNYNAGRFNATFSNMKLEWA